MSILEKLKKNSTIKATQMLSESEFFSERDRVSTDIPALNIALSGSVYGGFLPGLTFFAAPSKHFKTNFSLLMVSSYMKKYPDAVCLFYDSEYGATPEYFSNMGVDASRVVHTPITNVEELKFDLVAQLEAIEKGDKVIIMIDSIGNLASKKEVEDAKEQKSVADMSRAKALKSLFRIVTPYLAPKCIPMIAVNHTYQTLELYAKTIMGGGQGALFSANTVFFVTRAQEKEGNDLTGYQFTLVAHKSRDVRENSKIPITVEFDNGIKKWSGLFDIARELGWIDMPSSGWYTAQNPHTKELIQDKCRAKDIEQSDEFWEKMLAAGLDNDIQKHYRLELVQTDK